MQKFTQEQLMQYLYGEASPILKLAIDKAIADDKLLKKELKDLEAVKKHLDKLQEESESPGQKSIDSILNYAKKKK